ncbi:MAG: hypothetical protein A2X81_09645 [Desulfobacterales bacterium GWB2_56_26]|nr:MAG: hypothetical protein A2X81_09645 [Desulfobacterales bacterium GWB2_56_26]
MRLIQARSIKNCSWQYNKSRSVQVKFGFDLRTIRYILIFGLVMDFFQAGHCVPFSVNCFESEADRRQELLDHSGSYYFHHRKGIV